MVTTLSLPLQYKSFAGGKYHGDNPKILIVQLTTNKLTMVVIKASIVAEAR